MGSRWLLRVENKSACAMQHAACFEPSAGSGHVSQVCRPADKGPRGSPWVAGHRQLSRWWLRREAGSGASIWSERAWVSTSTHSAVNACREPAWVRNAMHSAVNICARVRGRHAFSGQCVREDAQWHALLEVQVVVRDLEQGEAAVPCPIAEDRLRRDFRHRRCGRPGAWLVCGWVSGRQPRVAVRCGVPCGIHPRIAYMLLEPRSPRSWSTSG